MAKTKKEVIDVVEEVVKEEVVKEEVVKEEVVKEEVNNIQDGEVFGCSALKIRSGANKKAPVKKIIKVKSIVKVDLSKSTDTFYHVTSAGDLAGQNLDTNIGFCMKKYIKLLG